MFIAMDPPKHDAQRKTVSPIVVAAQPGEHGAADPRAGGGDPGQLPIGETFDWVDKVSIELTTRCWPPCSTSRSRIGAS